MEDKKLDAPLIYKIVIIGDTGVGKTCFIERYCNDRYTDTYMPTIGVDFLIKTIEYNGNSIKLQIWDPASGRERFRSITSSYYRKSHCFFLVYDITNEISFRNMLSWYNDIIRYSTMNSIVIMVGTKKDLTQSRVVSAEEAMEIAKEKLNGIHVCEISSKTGEGINELMELCISLIDMNVFESSQPTPVLKQPHKKPESLVNWLTSWFKK